MTQHQDISRGPILPPKQTLNWRALGMALAAHGLLVLALVLNLDWKTEAQGPMQIELWAEGNSPANPPPQASKPVPQPEAKPEPEPEAEVPPPPPPPPPPPVITPPAVTEAPKAEVDPEIALEEERKKKAEEKRKKEEAEEKRKKEEARKEEQRIKREKELAEKKERERLEKERLEAERLEKEKKAKEEAVKKAAAEKREKEEKAKKDEAAAKKAAEDKKAKEAKDAKAAADKKAASDKALKDAFRNDALGVAGIPGGTADRNQSGGGNDTGYAGKVRQCIKPQVAYPTPARSGSANPTVSYVVRLKSDGTVSGLNLKKSSGITQFDDAVAKGIRRCDPFPKPATGGYPPDGIEVIYQMYD